jgi:ATP-dependent phosphoenolpyruvate carboxykinase
VKANEIKFDEAVFNNTDKAELFTDNQIKEAEAYLADRGAVTAKGEVVEGATVSKNTSVVPFKSKKQRRKDKRRATQIAREKIEGKPVVKPKVKAKPKKKPRPTHAPQRRGKTIGGRE